MPNKYILILILMMSIKMFRIQNLLSSQFIMCKIIIKAYFKLRHKNCFNSKYLFIVWQLKSISVHCHSLFQNRTDLLSTLKVEIFAGTNFCWNKFLRELIFAILVKFAKFAKISSRRISQKRQIREIFLKKRERWLQISSSSFPTL